MSAPAGSELLSHIVLREGITGGFDPALVQREATFGYDWNDDNFRVVVRKLVSEGPPPRYDIQTARISVDRFHALLGELRQGGLFELPRHDVPGSADAYGMGTSLRVRDGFGSWMNGAPASDRMKLPADDRPSEDELRIFADAVALVQRALAATELRAGSLLDEHSTVLLDGKSGDAFRTAVGLARAESFVDELDLNRACFHLETDIWTVHFPWVTQQPNADEPRSRSVGHWRHDYAVPFNPATHQAGSPIIRRPIDAVQQQARRRAWLVANPSISEIDRKLVSRGWVRLGMSADAVRAARGEPQATVNSRWFYTHAGTTETLVFEDGLLVQRM